MLSLALSLPLQSAAYAGIMATPLKATTSPATSAALFSAASLTLSSTFETEENQPEAMPTRLEVAAPPRALPKLKNDDSSPDPVDPISDLWTPKAPKGPKGPSVFKLNQGRAIDILRHDYPRLLTNKPDLTIFTENVELHDPSGKRLSGKSQYDKVFDMLRFLRRTTMQDAEVTYRVVVQDERIRVRWSCKLWMRDPALGLTAVPGSGKPALVHLDGVSNYDLDTDGKIKKHTLEDIVMRGKEDMPAVNLGFAWPTPRLATPEMAIPFFRQLDDSLSMSALFMGLNTKPQQQQQQQQPASDGSEAAKRLSRRLPYIGRRHRSGPAPQMLAGESPLERAARERADDAEKARRLAELRAPEATSKKGGGFFSAMKGTLPQQCETSYDCERPEVCCDLLFGSVCCSGGLMIPTTDPKVSLQRQAIPIPIDNDGPAAPGGIPPPGAGGAPPRY